MGKANYTFYHPDKDGRGTALKVEMHYQTDEKPGFFRLIFSNLKDCKADFESGIVCDLDLEKATELLMVFRGETEMTNNGKPINFGNGVFFAAKHVVENRSFALAGCRKGEKTEQISILMKEAEAIGLQLAMENSMFFLAFVKGVNP